MSVENIPNFSGGEMLKHGVFLFFFVCFFFMAYMMWHCNHNLNTHLPLVVIWFLFFILFFYFLSLVFFFCSLLFLLRYPHSHHPQWYLIIIIFSSYFMAALWLLMSISLPSVPNTPGSSHDSGWRGCSVYAAVPTKSPPSTTIIALSSIT